MTLVLDAIDSFNLARGNEIYLDALEHYVIANFSIPMSEREEILHLLRLFRGMTKKEFDQTENLLRRALRECHE